MNDYCYMTGHTAPSGMSPRMGEVCRVCGIVPDPAPVPLSEMQMIRNAAVYVSTGHPAFRNDWDTYLSLYRAAARQWHGADQDWLVARLEQELAPSTASATQAILRGLNGVSPVADH